MNFEPQKFFIGLVDFFSIFMPGALLAYVGKDWAANMLLGQDGYPLDGAEAWLVFFFASYLLGHFAFLLGATLDDGFYNPLRKCTNLGQVRLLSEGKILSSRRWRALATSRWLFGKNADRAVMKAEQIKARSLQQLSAARAVNAYQWSKVRLSLEHPEGLVEVQRFEANSKFFRSLVIVAGVLLLVSVILAISGEGEPWRLLALISAVALLLSLWRYVDQRFKATQQAYWFVISLESRKELSATDQALDQKGNRLTHAGGVVYRNEEGDLKYLLVQASGDRTEWVLPKGHIERGERPRDAAVREVEEETGYWAKVVRWICDQPLTVSGEHQRVRFYLMETAEDKQVVEEREKKKPWPQENRQRDWASLDKAIETATFKESKDLLKKAGELRLKIQEEDKIRQTPRI